MDRIHAIVVHHRGRTMLDRCLRSLLASEGVDLDIVVVCNGCDEDLPEVVEASPWIHPVECPEALGFSAANNLGVAWAQEHLGSTDAYYFINNDTQSHPKALDTLSRTLAARPSAGIVGPRLLILGAQSHLNSLELRVSEDAWAWDEGIGQRQSDYGPLPGIREVLAVTGSALLMRAEVFERVGGWAELYGYYYEDIDLCLRAWTSGSGVVQVPRAVVLHRISASVDNAQWKYGMLQRNRLFLAAVHWPTTLLWSLAKRALVDEVLRRRWTKTQLERFALREVLTHAPQLWSERRHLRRRFNAGGRGTEHAWQRFLAPPGSKPVITLPEIAHMTDDDRNAADSTVTDHGGPSGVTSTAETGKTFTGFQRASTRVPKSSSGRRVLVVGWAPLPFESARMNYAPGGRSWQLARAAVDAGHAVCLAVARMPGAYDDATTGITEDECEDVWIVHCDLGEIHGEPETETVLGRLVKEFQPDVLVGAAVQPSRWAMDVAGERPLWVDVFGDPMAEAQAKSMVEGDGDHVTAYWRLLTPLLRRGDAYAAVSERQAWALVGQLGLCGRLNRSTGGHDLVHTVPVSVEGPESAVTIEVTVEGANPEPEPLPGIGAKDFVLLWSGGYNTWCDTATLFDALDRAMPRCPTLRFVSTGGGIEGQDELTYRQFVEQIEAAEWRHRCQLLGRLPTEQAARYLDRADLAVVTERPLYERQLGSSGRVQHWMARGIPFVCARISELAEAVEAHSLGWTYPVGDAQALADAVETVLEDPRERARRARAGRRWAQEHLSFAATAAPLLRWLEDPQRAPDAASSGSAQGFEAGSLEQQVVLEETQQRLERARQERRDYEDAYNEVRAELGRIHHSRMWRWWTTAMAPFHALARLRGQGHSDDD